MKKTTVRILTLAGALAAAACVADETFDSTEDLEPRGKGAHEQQSSAGGEQSGGPSPAQGAGQSLADLGDVCPAWRLVVRMQQGEGVCPNAHGELAWKIDPLFEYQNRDRPTSKKARLYCLATWDDGNSDPSEDALAWLRDSNVDAFDRDCVAVTPEGDPIGDETANVLGKLTYISTGRLSADDLKLTETEELRSGVRIDCVDSMPNAAVKHPRLAHGETMARIAEAYACPGTDPSCKVEVVRSLGLPRYANGVDLDRGGVIASFSDIAQAIDAAVDSWRDSSPASPLIINLSIGWDSLAFAHNPVAQESVHVAIERARCAGALIIAAAGNESNLCTDGPLAPATWEQHSAPSKSRCKRLGFPDSPERVGYSPLVYAAGGLEADGTVLHNARSGGQPRLNATASHVAIVNAAGDRVAPTTTGTSVAAAIVSGAAGLLWSYFPTSTPEQIMAMIYDEAVPVPNAPAPDFWFDDGSGGEHTIRRLDLCSAVRKACNRPAESCFIPLHDLECQPITSIDSARGELREEFTALQAKPDEFDELLPVDPQPCGPDCSSTVNPHLGSVTTAYSDENMDAICSPPESARWMRFTRPQPDSTSCPTCGAGSESVRASMDDDDATRPGSSTIWVWLALSRKYDCDDLDYVTIDVRTQTTGRPDSTHERWVRFDIGEPQACSDDDIYKVRLDRNWLPSDVVITEMTVTMEFDGRNPSISPVMLLD